MDKFDALIGRLATSVAADYEDAREFARNRDPQRAGHEGESTWMRVLAEWGPGWPVVSRKYIVGSGGATNEVDVLVLKPDYPRHLRSEASVLSSGVAAAFSVKTTLRRADLAEALTQKRCLLAVAEHSDLSARDVLEGPILYGVLAHGMDTSALNNQQTARVEAWYGDVSTGDHETATNHPREELDGILVAEHCFLSTLRSALAPRGRDWQPMTALMSHHQQEAAGAPLAQFIYWLNMKLADGGRGAALAGIGSRYGATESSGIMRWWDTSIYPRHLLENRSRLLNDFGNSLVY